MRLRWWLGGTHQESCTMHAVRNRAMPAVSAVQMPCAKGQQPCHSGIKHTLMSPHHVGVLLLIDYACVCELSTLR